MAGVLRVDAIQTPAGDPVLEFNNAGVAKFKGNGIQFPPYTNSNRPSHNNGLIIYNSQEKILQVSIENNWVNIGSTKPNLPSGYNIAMTFNTSGGGLLAGSTWTVSQPSGTPSTYVSTGGIEGSGYFSNSGRSVSTNFFRIDQMPVTGTSTDLTFCIWYKGTQSIAPQTYGPAVPLFGDIRGSVYGGYGISNGRAEFRDAGNAYQGPLVNTDVWTHIAFSMTTGKTLKIYINGILTNTFTGVSVTTSYTVCSDIGAHYAYSGYTAPTAIDCPVVYSKILTDAEVLQVYNASNFVS